MNSNSNFQLLQIDRALLALLDERARLLAEMAATDPRVSGAAIDDLLRRHEGAIAAHSVREFFAAADRACAEAAR